MIDPELSQFRHAGGSQVRQFADGCPAVGVLGEEFCGHFLEDIAIRLVFPHTQFFFNDLTFGVKSILVDLEEAHSLGFQPQGQLDLVGWKRFMVDCLVKTGVGVTGAAHFPEQVKMVFFADTVRAFEHHMFEHMSITLTVGLLVFGADPVPHLHRNDGTRKIFQRDHFQSVIEGELLIIKQPVGL